MITSNKNGDVFLYVLRSLYAVWSFYVVESSKVGRGMRRDAHSPLAAVATRKEVVAVTSQIDVDSARVRMRGRCSRISFSWLCFEGVLCFAAVLCHRVTYVGFNCVSTQACCCFLARIATQWGVRNGRVNLCHLNVCLRHENFLPILAIVRSRRFLLLKTGLSSAGCRCAKYSDAFTKTYQLFIPP